MQHRDLIENIKQRKEELGWTIERISQESGIGIRTINRIFSGKDIRFSSIEAVVNALKLSLIVEDQDRSQDLSDD